MSTISADPAKTFAVVAAVETYDITDTNLDGPAVDAARFVSWLRGREVPAANIDLLASPLACNVGLIQSLGVTCFPATRQRIYDEFVKILPRRSGELLWLFWGGHGVLTGASQRRLIFADASDDDCQNLDLDSLLTSLHGDLCAGFPRQIAIIDACANYFANLSPPQTFPAEHYEQNCEQFALLASRPGEMAINSGARKSGAFSGAFLDELERSRGAPFPPDMSVLGACLGISIQVTSMDDQSVQVASIRPQCSFAPIPAA